MEPATDLRRLERRHAPLFLGLSALALLLGVAGLGVAARWLHLFFGVVWLGLLYFMNLVGVPGTRGYDSGARAQHVTQLVPRLLLWVRYSALVTVAAGFGLYHTHYVRTGAVATDAGANIHAGMALGLAMLGLAWGVVGPNQRRVVEATRANLETGAPPPPDLPRWSKRALAGSRAGMVLSLFLLLFMGAAGHSPLPPGAVAGLLAAAVVLAPLVALRALRSQ